MPATKYPRAHIAAIAIWAHGQHRSMAAEVAAHYNIDRRYAKRLVSVARCSGQPIPMTRPATAHPVRQLAVRASALRGSHLVCDCGWTIAMDAWAVGESLARHTLAAHHRAPTTIERTPRHTVNQPQEHA